MWKKTGYTEKGNTIYYDIKTGKNVTPLKRTGRFQKKIPDYAFAKIRVRMILR